MIQAASLVVLARLLSKSDFGIVAMVTAIVGIASVVGDFGLSLAAIQARSLNDSQKSNLFWLNSLLGGGLGLVVLALAQPVAAYYHNPKLVLIVRVLALTFLLNGVTTQFKAELSRSLRFAQLSLVDVLAQVAGFGVAVGAAVAGKGYWALVWQQIAIAATTLLLAVVISGWRPRLPSRGMQMRRFVLFGSNTMGVQALSYVSTNIDNVFVGRYWGAVSLGVYSRAYNLFELPVQQLAAPLTRVVLPILSRVVDDAQFLRYVRRAQLMMTYVLIGSFAAATSVAQPLVEIVLGHQWLAAAPIFQVLAIGGVFQALGYVYYWIFLAKGKTALQLRYGIIGRTAMVAMIFAGVHYAPIGAAGGSAAGLVLLWLLYSVWALPRAGIRVGQLNLDAVRVIALFTVTVLASQACYHAFLYRLGVWPSLLLGLLIDAACVGLGALLVRAVRTDLLTVLATVRMVIRRRESSMRAVRTPAPPATRRRHALAQGRLAPQHAHRPD